MLVTQHWRWDTQLWAKATMRSRRDAPCAICGQPVGERALRPITNAGNRMHRICLKCAAGEGNDLPRASVTEVRLDMRGPQDGWQWGSAEVGAAWPS